MPLFSPAFSVLSEFIAVTSNRTFFSNSVGLCGLIPFMDYCPRLSRVSVTNSFQALWDTFSATVTTVCGSSDAVAHI